MYGLRSSLKEDNVKSKLSEDDVKALEEEIQKAIDWLDKNGDAEEDDFQRKYREVEEACSPIMQKAFAAGGQGGAAPGGPADMGGQASGGGGGGGGGPKVEEVD